MAQKFSFTVQQTGVIMKMYPNFSGVAEQYAQWAEEVGALKKTLWFDDVLHKLDTGPIIFKSPDNESTFKISANYIRLEGDNHGNNP